MCSTELYVLQEENVEVESNSSPSILYLRIQTAESHEGEGKKKSFAGSTETSNNHYEEAPHLINEFQLRPAGRPAIHFIKFCSHYQEQPE